MTPPDPATPSPLEALLKEVDRAVTDPRSFREDAFDWSAAAQSVRSDAAPRLAAIVRVLMDATQEMLDADSFLGACRVRGSALRRADEIAGGGT